MPRSPGAGQNVAAKMHRSNKTEEGVLRIHFESVTSPSIVSIPKHEGPKTVDLLLLLDTPLPGPTRPLTAPPKATRGRNSTANTRNQRDPNLMDEVGHQQNEAKAKAKANRRRRHPTETVSEDSKLRVCVCVCVCASPCFLTMAVMWLPK